ncbi:MAG: hypothetical protein HWN65_13105 [Candidatus Helarchaeota archaeon]|nr:hypothetical protein [Candidatus Helarchaeota archaeon]
MNRKCSVMNCQKELKEGEGRILGDKIYCTECAIILIKEELAKAGLHVPK